MISVYLVIKFNTTIKSIDDGVNHLRAVLSTGSSHEIYIQPKYASDLCPLHSDLDVEILERDDAQLSAKVKVKYPICLCGRDSGISTFLGSVLYYTVFSFVLEYQILDFDITEENEMLALFPGPRHGVSGIRELIDEMNEPLIGVILKPRTRIDLETQKHVIGDLAKSGKIHYIIDDELVISPKCCGYEEKIDCYSSIVNQIAQEVHHKMLYWVNASCDLSVAEKIIDYSLSKGVRTISLNAVTMGFTAVKYLIEKYCDNAFFMVNNIGRGILTRPPGFFMSEQVLAKITRLIGADAVYTGPLTKEFSYDSDILSGERRSLQDVWYHYKKCFAVSSGDIETSRHAIANVQALGKDTMIQMGSGLLGTRGVVGKLTSLKFLIVNALNTDVLEHIREAFVADEQNDTHLVIRDGRTMTEDRDFFISYNRNDELWATWIANVLENEGYSTYLQAWDIRPGDDFIEKMDFFLCHSKRFMPVLSKTYLEAPYCNAEKNPALAAAISNNDKSSSFVAVRIDDVLPTGLLFTRVYINLFGLEEESAKNELLAGIKSKERKHAGGFPGKNVQ